MVWKIEFKFKKKNEDSSNTAYFKQNLDICKYGHHISYWYLCLKKLVLSIRNFYKLCIIIAE